jgi:hypothetical protein
VTIHLICELAGRHLIVGLERAAGQPAPLPVSSRWY